jgi:hypothetical protein
VAEVISEPAPSPARATTEQRQRSLAIAGLLLGVTVAGVLRLVYALEAKDFLWFDSDQYINVSHHPFFSMAFWSGSQPPLVPLMWKLTGTPTGFAVLQSVVAAVAWGFLAWTVWTCLGRRGRAVAGAWVVLAFSLTPYVLQWDASVLSESVSLACVAVIFGSGLWLIRRFTWPRASFLLGACLLFALARDAGVEVVAAIGLGLAAIAAFHALRHHGGAKACAILAAVVLGTAGVVGLAGWHAHRNVLNVENSLYVRVFPYPSMVASFAAQGMPQGKQIDVVARTVAEEQPTNLAFASPIPSRSTAVVVGPVLTLPYWEPLREWITAHGEGAYLDYLVSHPAYVFSAPFRRPSLAFNSPSTLAYYKILGHDAVPGSSVLFPRRLVVLILGLVAAALLSFRGIWRRPDVAFLVAMIPLGIFAMAVGWFGDGQEIARHMIEGNVMVRLAVLLLLLWGLLAPAPPSGRVADLSGEEDGDALAVGDSPDGLAEEPGHRDHLHLG